LILRVKREEFSGSYIKGALRCVLPTKQYSVDEIRESKMGEACGTRGGVHQCRVALIIVAQRKETT